ncbi:UreD urease accessory protein [Gigaspora rosea]|uniref:UreD urease accessory protein n=1 Tax=Gigaspora rosea TaxID=44941 RepID=A0A397U4S7_9GLOM|nr:UreD urease accessory protein [Gigaspora rosea]
MVTPSQGNTPDIKPPPGHGKITCHLPPGTKKPTFSTFRASYPLKFLTPKTHKPNLAAVYFLSYGGGLVSGDSICVDVEIFQNVNLMLLTQGSTKIYKQRAQKECVNDSNDGLQTEPKNLSSITRQSLNAYVHESSILLQLPEPTTCFRDAEYIQSQTFSLENNASVVILDWFTSGRMSRGERWEFARYESGVNLLVGGKLIFRDVVLLQNENEGENNISNINSRLKPYECFATLVIYGPKVISLTNHLMNEFDKIVVDKMDKIADLIWSASALHMEEENVRGVVIKVAGITTEIVRRFLVGVALKGLDEVIGENLFERAL